MVGGGGMLLGWGAIIRDNTVFFYFFYNLFNGHLSTTNLQILQSLKGASHIWFYLYKLLVFILYVAYVMLVGTHPEMLC